MENMNFDDLGLLLEVIEIRMVLHILDSPYPLWHLHLLCEHSHTLSLLAWNVKLLLYSLDLIACIIIALSCILLLVRLDLFAACGVHWSDYSCFLCGLICSPLCVTMLWLWPMLFRHGVHFQYRCEFSWLVFTPVLRWIALMIHIFLVVDGEWVVLVIVDDFSRSCGFCA
jgi:hypothetical protein